MVAQDPLERLRAARIEDVGGILRLIEPLEADGTLVKRSRELLEMEIDRFSVLEHDSVIVGCAALYPFAEDGARARLPGRPSRLPQCRRRRPTAAQSNAGRRAASKRLFVLTTRAAHWFIERGFAPAEVDALPEQKQQLYNYSSAAPRCSSSRFDRGSPELAPVTPNSPRLARN